MKGSETMGKLKGTGLRNSSPRAVYTNDDLREFRKNLRDGQEFEWDDLVECSDPDGAYSKARKVRRTYVIMNRWPHFVDAYRKDKPRCRKSFTYIELMIGLTKKKTRA